MGTMRTCILLVVVLVVLASVILFFTNFCRFSLLYSNDTRADSPPPALSVFSTPWRTNDSRDAIRLRQSELMRSFINHSVDPCDDFYEYACGNWEKINPIPRDRWIHSTMQLLHNNLEIELRDLLQRPMEGKEPPSAKDKAKIFYKNCMNENAIAKRGTEPLMDFIKELGGWPVLDDTWPEENFDWLQLAVKLSSIGSGVIIGYEVEKNPTVPTEYTIFLKQTSLGMTNRDNFLKKENAKNLESYTRLIERVLRLLEVNEETARNASREIANFEIRLANATLPPEDTKTKPYLQPNIQLLNEGYAYIDWLKYFSEVQQAELDVNQTVVVQLGVKYYENLYYVLINTDNKTLANYMVWRGVLFGITLLDKPFRDAWNDFHKAVTGQVESTPVWKTCVNIVNWNMGMTTSSMFVEKYFDESSKNETIKIINSLKDIFDENLDELDWIDNKTKAYASKKANAMTIAAGYPDYILSDEALNKLHQDVKVVHGKHFENCLNLVRYYWRRNRNKLFKSYDRDQWFLPPTMVNALYDTGANRIIVLAGLLQPPVFHQHFPQSLNYGAMGMFMGHEIIHGFDDLGRKFDINGDSLSWWSAEAILEFNNRKKCFLEQYEEFSKEDESFKSIATISENLADNGGLRLAYKAYRKWKEMNLLSNSTIEETLPGMELNEDQMFFLSFAQLFCAAIRPEAEVESKSYESHSPRKYRVLGAITNFEMFSEVYGCPVNSTMNPKNKCRMW